MAFDLRCPDCKAKLRLDEEPERGVPIECPKCGSTFTPGAAKSTDTVKKGKRKEPAKAKDKENSANKSDEMEAKERTFMNPFLLLGIILAGLGAYAAVAFGTLNVLSRSGKVEDMVSFVPIDADIVRGANLKVLSEYPGYKGELDKYVNAPVKAGLVELVKAAGVEDNAFDDYMIYAGSRPAGAAVFIFRCRQNLDPETVKTGLGATEQAVDGTTCLSVPASAPGVLSGSVIVLPSKRYIVLAPAGTDQPAVIRASMAGWNDRSRSFVEVLGDTGRVVIRGHSWLLVRGKPDDPTNPLQNTIRVDPNQPDKDLGKYVEAAKKARVGGMWNTFGGSVRFGAAIDCGTAAAASALAKTLREGPLGQGDAAELPRPLKEGVSWTYGKDFRALLDGFRFSSTGSCAYVTSSLKDNQALKMLESISIGRMVDGGVPSGPGGGTGNAPAMPGVPPVP